MFKKYFPFILVIFAALVIRLILSPFGNNPDLFAFAEWGNSLGKYPLNDFYFKSGWIFSSPTQPPVLNYLLVFSNWFYS